jgi:hypothetical protein
MYRRSPRLARVEFHSSEIRKKIKSMPWREGRFGVKTWHPQDEQASSALLRLRIFARGALHAALWARGQKPPGFIRWPMCWA